MAQNVGISFARTNIWKKWYYLICLCNPSPFGSNCCCIATEALHTCFTVMDALRPPFPVVWVSDGYSTLYRDIGVFLSVFSPEEGTHGLKMNILLGTTDMVNRQLCGWTVVWHGFSAYMLHFVVLFDS